MKTWGSWDIATPFLTLALNWGEWTACPDSFPPGNKPTPPANIKHGFPPNRSGHCKEQKIYDPAGNRIPAVQPLESPYADWAVVTSPIAEMRRYYTLKLLIQKLQNIYCILILL
jgi:hypothetical protein